MAIRLDSALKSHRDSIAAIPDPMDWTVGEGKSKIGIDPKWIYLGPIKLPTALLALVPMNVQANPNQREAARTLGAMAAEVRERADMNGATQDEIRAIRARMDRQRAARRAAEVKGGSGTSGGGGGKVPPPR